MRAKYPTASKVNYKHLEDKFQPLQGLLVKMQSRALTAGNLLTLINGNHASFSGKNYFAYRCSTIEAELYVRYNTWTPYGREWGAVVHIHYPAVLPPARPPICI